MIEKTYMSLYKYYALIKNLLSTRDTFATAMSFILSYNSVLHTSVSPHCNL